MPSGSSCASRAASRRGGGLSFSAWFSAATNAGPSVGVGYAFGSPGLQPFGKLRSAPFARVNRYFAISLLRLALVLAVGRQRPADDPDPPVLRLDHLGPGGRLAVAALLGPADLVAAGVPAVLAQPGDRDHVGVGVEEREAVVALAHVRVAERDRAFAEIEVGDRVERVGVRRHHRPGLRGGEPPRVRERVDGRVALRVGTADAGLLAADPQELEQREAVVVGLRRRARRPARRVGEPRSPRARGLPALRRGRCRRLAGTAQAGDSGRRRDRCRRGRASASLRRPSRQPNPGWRPRPALRILIAMTDTPNQGWTTPAPAPAPAPPSATTSRSTPARGAATGASG